MHSSQLSKSENPVTHDFDLQREERMETILWWQHLLWIVAAGVIGFVVATIFAGQLQLSRRWFLVPHLLLSGGLVVAYFWWSGIDLVALIQRHWIWGIIGAVAAGAFLVANVLSQPVSARNSGAALLFDLFWLGGVYGLLDAMFLSVLPIVAAWQAFAALGWTDNWPGRIGVGALAFLFSLVVTAAYHLGFPEFAGSRVGGPIIGNGVSSLAAIVTANPLGAMLSHLAMHVAAVLQGPATTIQLPPHY
jgi:hypothetical protein